MNVGYIVARYPQPSETFLFRELLALHRSGERPTVFYLQMPSIEDIMYPGLENIPAVRAPGVFSGESLRAMIWVLTDRPFHFLKFIALLCALLIRSPRYGFLLGRKTHHVMYFARYASIHGIKHVHAYFLNAPAILGTAVATILDCSFSAACHARDLFCHSAPVSLVGRRADFIVACSNSVGSELTRRLSQIQQSKVHVIYHGLDTADFVDEEIRSDSGEIKLLFVGRFVEKKGLQFLIACCKQLKQQSFAFRLLLAGDGILQATIERQVKQAGLEQQVHFLGWCSRQHIRELMTECTMLLVPSQTASDGDRDGIPNAILEAFALRLPVVATDSGGLREVIEPGMNGLLAPAGNVEAFCRAIVEMGTSRDCRERITAGAGEYAKENFDVDRNIQSLIHLFEGSIHERQRV